MNYYNKTKSFVYHYKCQILCTIFALLFLLSEANPSTGKIWLNSEKQIYNLASEMLVYKDSTNEMNIDEASCEHCPIVFKRNNSRELHNNHSKDQYWYKIKIENKLPSVKTMFLEFSNSTIPFLTLFVKKSGRIYEFPTTGSLLPFNTRKIENSKFCYQIDFLPNEELNLYVHINPMGDALNTPVYLYDSISFTKKTSWESSINGIYYGLMFLIIALSLILIISFTSLTERSNFYFIGIISLFTLWNASLDGLAFQYLWPTTPILTDASIFILPLAGIILLSLFAEERNRNNIYSLFLYNFKIILSGIIVLFIIYTLIFKLSLIKIHTITILLGCSQLTITFISWYNHLKQKPNFNLLFIFLFSTITAWLVIITLKIYTNILPYLFYYYSFKIFLGLQAIILSIAVISQMRIKFTKVFSETLATLDKEVTEKDSELLKKIEEIQSINNDMTSINNILHKQQAELKLKDEQLTNSIAYVKNIQKSITPTINSALKFEKQLFVLHKPKHELFSDIYYIKQIDNILYAAILDCSGSGVPGSVFATLAYNILHRIITSEHNYETDVILNIFQKDLLEILHSNDSDFFKFDSVDIGIVKIETTSNIISYSGTKIPLLVFSKDFYHEYKGETNSLGINFSKHENNYEVHKIELSKGDMLYLFTNGYTNQLNETGTKLMKKNLKQLLSENHSNPVNLQKNELEKYFNKWKGNTEQTDDILIVGVKI